jgi:Arc/MetJ family transcription regulator
MRTTIRLDDRLLAQAKREAARRGETLTTFPT